jgi:hypothetical protein
MHTPPDENIPDSRMTPEAELLANERPEAPEPEPAPIGSTAYSFTFVYRYGNRTRTVKIEEELSDADAFTLHYALKLVLPFVRSRQRARTKRALHVETAILFDWLRCPDPAALARRHRAPAAYIAKLASAFETYRAAALQQPDVKAWLMRDPSLKRRLKRLERLRSVPPSDGRHST